MKTKRELKIPRELRAAWKCVRDTVPSVLMHMYLTRECMKDHIYLNYGERYENMNGYTSLTHNLCV